MQRAYGAASPIRPPDRRPRAVHSPIASHPGRDLISFVTGHDDQEATIQKIDDEFATLVLRTLLDNRVAELSRTG